MKGLYFPREACHFCDFIHDIFSLGRAVKPHFIPYAQESDGGPSMNHLEVSAFEVKIAFIIDRKEIM